VTGAAYDATVSIMADGPIQTVTELASTAESLGFKSCWLLDEGVVTRDVYVTLTAIALATKTLRLGTGITNPYTRHAATTAAAIASLDEISGGRAFVGIGAGGGLTLNPLAIERKQPLGAVREMVEVLRLLFSGESVSYRGRKFELDRATLDYARRDIKIWIAGRGPKMLAQAGAIADGVHLSYVHKDTIGDSVALIGSAGTNIRPKISWATAFVTDNSSLTRTQAQLTFRLVDSPEGVKELLGLTPGHVGALREALAAGGPAMAAELVREEWVSQFAILGTPTQCAAEVRSLMTTHGIDEFQVPVADLGSGPHELETASEILFDGT